MPLIDFYKSRFGSTVKQQGNGWNGPCPLCGGDPGRSDRFMVWPDRDEKLGQTCAEKRIAGIWSCRQCGSGGDTIAYLMQVDGMDFKAALAELGIEGGRPGHKRRPAPPEPRRESAAFTPNAYKEPLPEWQAYAAKLLDEATAAIATKPEALAWLASRGIPAEAVKQYRIGYLPPEGAKYPGRWRARSALGLPPKETDDGKVRDKIFIPRGIVIPTFAQDGSIRNLRIRRHQQDLQPMANGKMPPKYLELEGSCTAPLLLRSSSQTSLAAYFVTEAELDAILIHFVTGGVVGGLAVRTNRGKPDCQAHERLRQAVKVCIALDFDEPGAVGAPWWEQTYSQAVRWPVPEGKDPGEAFKLGVDIRDWVAAALPATIKLPTDPREASIAQQQASVEYDSQNGRMDLALVGPNECGERGSRGRRRGQKEKKEGGTQMRTSGDVAEERIRAEFTPEELRLLLAAMPQTSTPLSFYPVEVLRAYLLWRDMPVSFYAQHDEAGNCLSMGWNIDYAWREKRPENRKRFEIFSAYQDKCQVLWRWFSAHPDKTINWRNLLDFWR
jgi:hypothetical protein